MKEKLRTPSYSYESQIKNYEPSNKSRLSNYMNSIDEKYDKYVKKGSIKGSQASKFFSKGSIEEFPSVGKSSSHFQYQDYTQWNRENQENYENSSRLATGKFNFLNHEEKSSSRNQNNF